MLLCYILSAVDRLCFNMSYFDRCGMKFKARRVGLLRGMWEES